MSVGRLFPVVVLTAVVSYPVYSGTELPAITPGGRSEPVVISGRWYTRKQVVRGRKLFAVHCAICHGEHAAGTTDWRKSDANGNFPPPPLNGTAHTWHHPLTVLRETVRQGGVPLGGVMPAFAEKLSVQEIDSIIAWFQSLWPEEIYQQWYRIEQGNRLQE